MFSVQLAQSTRVFSLALAFMVCGERINAQGLADVSLLEIAKPADCAQLIPRIRGRESGGQWLIGDGIKTYGLPGSRNALGTLTPRFDKVSCYGISPDGSESRIFVSDANGLICGWVDKEDLLDPHLSETTRAFDQRQTAVCPTPRAMPFGEFCEKLTDLMSRAEAVCLGVPAALRAKGVLVGATDSGVAPEYSFYTAPRGGKLLESRRFFSVLEIYDLDRGDDHKVMALVGDGEGDMFGWVDLAALELWPTRLGLFYDEDGLGGMFRRQRSLIQSWRNQGKPEPDIISGKTEEELREFIHGRRQLLSYPIMRTVDPRSDPAARPDDVPYHEVIFLGQTGDGSASTLMSQAELSERVDQLRKMNLMVIVDTTESMRDYLPLVQQGIVNFIQEYGQSRLDATQRLPDVRLSVWAYSDFVQKTATAPNDSIRTERLVPPTPIGQGYNIGPVLDRIAAHKGLDDSAGLREESALETVMQLSSDFDRNDNWFNDGQRVIIHIADHGSRQTLKLDQVLKSLKDRKVVYLPIPVITDDKGDPNATAARKAFWQQAKTMLAPLFETPVTDQDIIRIDLSNFRSKTPAVVKRALDEGVKDAVLAINTLRAELIGDLARFSLETQDQLSSRIRMDQVFLENAGLDGAAQKVIVEASTGYAPFQIYNQGLAQTIDWTYTLALEPDQARSLQRNFEQMCPMVGRPEQRIKMRQLIVDLAEVFSGDTISSDSDVIAVISDLRNLPGADKSFLSLPLQVLITKIDSTDPAVVDSVRKDVCWTSYHLGNMNAELYVRPDQVGWTGSEFALRSGEEGIKRIYRYKPLVGAEMVYVPSFFFVLPSKIETLSQDETCEFFCN